MTDFPRLIEYAFPLKQASLDSVHEKNVRHGHISTLHIWPARRPLAACRAALIATLLPDPGDPEKRRELCEKIGGKVVEKIEKKKMPNGQTVERIKEETEGGILHWLESEPEKSQKKKWQEWHARKLHFDLELQWFREEIKKTYDGRAPKVLDPFAGGGAIPLEAMRLGCEATAVDINPVAWFILKCTLEYPQKLAGQTRRLPDFILHDDAFMAEFFKKAKGYSKAENRAALKRLHDRLKKKSKRKAKNDQRSLQFSQHGEEAAGELQADLAWHVRAWGQWVLDRARRELAQYYPIYADFQPIKKDLVAYEHQPMRLLPLKEDGTPDIDSLNDEFTSEYLDDKRNPRWVAKPTVAYLWARTVKCKNCRATVPLLKTRWLCKKANKRVLLLMTPNAEGTGVDFGVDSNVVARGGNAAQKREHDKQISAGTMSRAGAKCPICGTISTGEDIRTATVQNGFHPLMTAVVVEGTKGKEYRVPTPLELDAFNRLAEQSDQVVSTLPEGELVEPIPKGASRAGGGSAFTVYLYGLTRWKDIFSPRQKATIATFARIARSARRALSEDAYSPDWSEAVTAYLSILVDKLADRESQQCIWICTNAEKPSGSFGRFALQVTWDFVEVVPWCKSAGGLPGSLNLVAEFVEHASRAATPARSRALKRSVLKTPEGQYDLILTDPPYYDAIPYSDLMDFFYIWLRRMTRDASPEFEEAFRLPLSPKWDYDDGDGELIDDSGRHGGSLETAKRVYEEGMYEAFARCGRALSETGRLVIVFAHKNADAWETLASSVIRAGFVVDASWPIQTERSGRIRAQTSAALSSSVWLVCKKRSATARPGWDNNVLEEMKENIAERLREFWDAGIRGPDFVWAATGPALEAYSKHPVVRKANEQNATMNVSEFLNHVRRMVVDYVVGQVLTGEQGSDLAAADRLDEVTAYYLLHRHDFGMDEAPVGACILYATACGLTDGELDRTWNILSRSGSDSSSSDGDNASDDSNDSDVDGDAEASEGAGGSKVKLKPWNQRRSKNMGNEAPEGRVVPLIDRIHRVMHLWKGGDQQKVDEYLDQHALRRNELFKRVVQSLIELSSNSERTLLERISNHIGAKGAVKDRGPMLPFGEDE